ncbi:AsmA-like C-terminal region [Methylorubrum salsuginis]|uniref:AsmA-like C-terminal region n=1 Tax=Methylorubrum salsuginis TaxID=414703 RepID=A0A1I4FG79_9HYPH|nr:AsmA-like C-terminal region [Methylorubrum salsuginis]
MPREAKANSVRDLLTALAGAVVLILVAALTVPPFIDWSGQRALIDRAITQSLGTPARSEGAVDLRLLPSPHLRLDRLILGAEDGPALDAHTVDAEIALAPLLKGEVRFTGTVIERARVTVPVAQDALLLPRSGEGPRRDVVIEALSVRRLSVATVHDGAAPNELFSADDVRLKAPALAGPWLAEGMVAGSPFHLATGTMSADGALALKLTGGGDALPRLEADARLAFKPESVESRRGLVPEAEGSAKLTVGPPVQPAGDSLPLTLAAKFEARGTTVNAKSVELELDPGGKAVRLSGTGRIDLRAPRAGLELRTRRLDLDGLLLTPGGRALMSRGAAGLAPSLPMLLDLDLKAESVALGLDDWSDVAFRGTFDRSGGLVLRRFSGQAPGASTVAATGEIDLSAAARFNGHIEVAARNSEGLGRYLGRLGAEEAVAALLDGRALDLGADVSSTAADLSLRNLRLTLGSLRVTGNAAYTRPQSGHRGRLEAQIAANGIDIAELPPTGRLMEGLDRHDLGLTLSARDVRYGGSTGGGAITVRLQSDGASLVVDSLDIENLAGASARLAGRIAPDGSGRIEGRVSAPKAAPLLALLERGYLAEARLVPRAFREAGLDLAVTLEREAGEADALRAHASGKAGGGEVDLSALTRAGRIDDLAATLDVARAGLWFGRDDLAAFRQPARLRLTGTRTSEAATAGRGVPPLAVTAEGSFPGLTLATRKPILLDAADRPPLGGEIGIAGADLGPALALAGTAVPTPLPAALTLALSRRGEAPHLDLSGKAGGTDLTASLDRGLDGAWSGTASLGQLGLPALSAALILPTEAHGTRFAPAPSLPLGSLDLRVGRLDLGRGFTAEAATFRLQREGDALRIADLTAGLGGGRIGASLTLSRPAGGAAVAGEARLQDVSLPRLLNGGRLAATVSGALRFSASGPSPAALADDLSGNGDVRLSDIRLPEADPAALDRALVRALAEDDPLRDGRPQALVSEEFAAGPLVAKGPVSAAVTLVGGVLRSAPFTLDLGPGRWTGTVAVDLRQGSLDARGTLTSTTAPKGWSGAPPAVQLGFSGSLASPERRVDAAPLTTGLAALVLQRELEKIELFDADQAERQRRRARIEMDRARAAVEEAARQARIKAQQAAEEAAREAAKEAAKRQREADEAARRARQEAEPAPSSEAPAPLDITPPPRP